MIKELKKFQIKLTPFQAAKNWELDNVHNENLLLLEQTGSSGEELAVALEFIDYGDGSSGYPLTGSVCSIALEQQDNDLVHFREGLKLTGLFYPASDPTNFDGTYKRVVYAQVKSAFYNAYRNPAEIWGIEDIDFELSKTKRRITDQLRMWDIPRLVFGEKIVPGSVRLYDASQDNEYIITDDGNGNLFAGTNLFSKQQEIRTSFGNEFAAGSDATCDSYWVFDAPSGSLILNAASGSAVLTWNTNITNEDYFRIWKSIDGNSYTNFATASIGSREYTDTTVTSSYFTASTYWYQVDAVNAFGSASSNTASISFLYVEPSISLNVYSGSAIAYWTTSIWDAEYYTLQRSVNGIDWMEITTTIPSVKMFTDTTVTSSYGTGSTYWYRVAAIHAGFTSSFSNTASRNFLYPSLPIQLEVYSGSAIANWTTSIWDTDYFTVQRSINSGSIWTEIATTNAATKLYTDTTVTSSETGATYWYRVASIHAGLTSSFSNEAVITFTSSAAVDVLSLTASAVEALSYSASFLFWTSSVVGELYHTIYRSTDGLVYSEYDNSASSSYTYYDYNVTGSTIGTTYWYKVAAVKAGSTSSFSNTASVEFFVEAPLYCVAPPFIAYGITGSTTTPITL